MSDKTNQTTETTEAELEQPPVIDLDFTEGLPAEDLPVEPEPALAAEDEPEAEPAIEPEAEPELEGDPAKAGLLNDLRGERAKRQTAEAIAETLRAEIDEIKTQLVDLRRPATGEAKPAEPEPAEPGMDDILTRADWERLQAKRDQQAQEVRRQEQERLEAQQKAQTVVAGRIRGFLDKHDKAGTPTDVHPRDLLTKYSEKIPAYIVESILAKSERPGEELYAALLAFVPEARQVVARRRGEPAKPAAGRIPGLSVAAGAPTATATPLQSLARATPDQLSQEIDDFFTVPVTPKQTP